jgi:hypothetical protein
MHCSVDGTAAPMKPSQVRGRRGRRAGDGDPYASHYSFWGVYGNGM